MAAIDKMYVHWYHDYETILKWAIAYYPQLLFYFYNIHCTYEEFNKQRKDYVKLRQHINTGDLEKIGGDKNITPHAGALKLMEHYKEGGYDCPYEQAIDETIYILETAHKDEIDLEAEFSFPVTNTPCSVDRKLLWICPVPAVRKYLHEQCGYKKRWEWLYKIFWKGKKHI